MSSANAPTPEQLEIIVLTATVLNSISILACLIVVAVYFYCRTKFPQLVDRVSLRLAVVISVIDLLYSAFQIFSDVLTVPGPVCAFSVWGYLEFSLVSLLLTASVAMNLQMIFIHNKRDMGNFERWYYGVSFGVATAVVSAGWAAGAYGWDPIESQCWYVEDGTLIGTIWQWLTGYVWLAVAILYCFGVVAVVLHKVSREQRQMQMLTTLGIATRMQEDPDDVSRYSMAMPPTPVDANRFSMAMAQSPIEGNRYSMAMPLSPVPSSALLPGVGKAATTKLRREERRRKRATLLRIMKRIILYPVVPIITQSMNLVVTMQAYVLGYNTFVLLLLCFIGTSVQGLLNALVFLMDPNVKSCLTAIRHGGGIAAMRATPSSMSAGASPNTEHATLIGEPDEAYRGGIRASALVNPQDLLKVNVETGWKLDMDDWMMLL